MAVALCLFVAGLATITTGAVLGFFFPAWWLLALFIPGGVLMFVSPAFALPARKHRGVLARLYEDGLVLYRNGESQVCRWTDVVALREVTVANSAPGSLFGWSELVTFLSGDAPRLTLRTRSGEDLVFFAVFRRFGKLRTAIKKATLPSLLARAHATIRGGFELPFGDALSLTADGLHQYEET